MNKHENTLQILEQRIGYIFKDKNILAEALTHRSHKKSYNNERLEFLGDAVLDLIVGEFLFLKFPHAQEGELSKMRATMVNEKSFAALAQKFDIGAFIYLSTAEENNHGRNKSSLLSDAFEAIFGAIYLEAGFQEAKKIMFKILEEMYGNIDIPSLSQDYKTMLQELTQAIYGEIPEYIIVGSSGPDHNKEFEVAVCISGRQTATAKGGSKKKAQQKAAQIAFMELQNAKAKK